MLKWLIALALLSGWLTSEIKDFFFDGGWGNRLAIGLFKISTLFVLIAMVIMVILFPQLLLRNLESLNQKLNQERKNNFKRNGSKSASRRVLPPLGYSSE
jgi:hypothetical protein